MVDKIENINHLVEKINTEDNKDTIIQEISKVLNELVTINDSSINQDCVTSKFDVKKKLKMSISDYIKRAVSNTQAESSTLIVSMILIDRICDTEKVALTGKSVHKLFITSLVLAIKMNEDLIYDLKYYSQVAGIPSRELETLEEEFLKIMDFKVNVKLDEFLDYVNTILPQIFCACV